jgi:AmmeMemoRadiSam system protein B
VNVRWPAVAGRFYPAEPERLRRAVRGYLRSEKPATPALAVMAPHAGYVYSGPVAGAVYASVAVPDAVVLLHFDHRRAEPELAIWTRGAWRTPLGDAPIDEALAGEIARGCPGLAVDPPHQAQEHSGEVQVPFLQVCNPRVSIVPVGVSCRPTEPGAPADLGEGLARVLAGREALVVASSDMNHYEADGPTRRKDAVVIEAILKLDAVAMIEAIETHDVSMCGAAPALAMIAYARARGARSARLAAYDTSATASGDAERVVGYAGIVVERAP